MRIVVDGNDGTGKTTLVDALRKRGYTVIDRGIPTIMTDNPDALPDNDEFYLILDAPIEVCRGRLIKAGKDLTERYHTVEGLRYYRQQFFDVAKKLKNCFMIDASGSPEHILKQATKAIRSYQQK